MSEREQRAETLPSEAEKPLNKRQSEVCRRLVAGHRPTEISHALNMSLSSIGRIRNLPAAKAYIQELEEAAEQYVKEGRDAVGERLRDLAPRAVGQLDNLMAKAEDGELSPKMVLDVAKEVLDRTGFPRQTQASVAHLHAHVFDEKSISRLVAAGQALDPSALSGVDFLQLGCQLRGEVVDVEPELVEVEA